MKDTLDIIREYNGFSTSASKDTLLPCPFCGGKAEWAEVYNPDPILRLVSVGCEACNIHFRGCRETLKGAREVAIAKWNRRAE